MTVTSKVDMQKRKALASMSKTPRKRSQVSCPFFSFQKKGNKLLIFASSEASYRSLIVKSIVTNCVIAILEQCSNMTIYFRALFLSLTKYISLVCNTIHTSAVTSKPLGLLDELKGRGKKGQIEL